MNYLIQDGKSNYLEGGLLIAVYIVYSEKFEMLTCQIIAVAVWFYPTLDST